MNQTEATSSTLMSNIVITLQKFKQLSINHFHLG